MSQVATAGVRLLPGADLPAYAFIPGTDLPHPFRDPRGHDRREGGRQGLSPLPGPWEQLLAVHDDPGHEHGGAALRMDPAAGLDEG